MNKTECGLRNKKKIKCNTKDPLSKMNRAEVKEKIKMSACKTKALRSSSTDMLERKCL